MNTIDSNSADKPSNSTLRIVETFLAILGLVYFLAYPRDTLSDFVVLTSLCLLLILGGNKVGLFKPKASSFAKADALLAAFSLTAFIGIWIYAAVAGKVNLDTASRSIAITIVYFYYAWIQHFLAQRYLALRMLGLSSRFAANSSSRGQIIIRAAALVGCIFGLVHCPYPNLMLPAAFGGFIYAYYFLTTGRLWAVVSSHALVSSAGIFWFLDDNPFTELIALF